MSPDLRGVVSISEVGALPVGGVLDVLMLDIDELALPPGGGVKVVESGALVLPMPPPVLPIDAAPMLLCVDVSGDMLDASVLLRLQAAIAHATATRQVTLSILPAFVIVFIFLSNHCVSLKPAIVQIGVL